MKTISKINPEMEYENAKNLVEQASKCVLDSEHIGSLDSSLDNLITATRVLIEREERRRGRKKPPKNAKPKGRSKGDLRSEAKKLPSKRFPNLEIRENIICPEKDPICPCCNEDMKESGLFDTSEKLETIPQQYYIQRTKRPKFNCGNCHGSMVNTPAALTIVPTSNYGDSLIIDATLSKFCDLIPMERYVQIAFRNGLDGLPAQSLIGLTHHLANFFLPLYLAIKNEVLATSILLADETPHKMLEGDDRKNWYLWGFFSTTACYFETHNTRSGDVAFNFLKDSKAKYLVTDAYGGYGKAIRLVKEEFDRDVIEVHCNAHSFRYIEEASTTWKEESSPLLDLYGKIYELERQRKEGENTLSSEEQLKLRKEMIPFFNQMKEYCEEKKADAMPSSLFEKCLNYFLNHYKGLTQCTANIDIPLDNNLSEREIRPSVVGRKTWYGTHSKRGATTTAVHFTIVQSCKLNNVNPRNYYPWIKERMLRGEELLTPYEYSKIIDSG